MYPEMEGQFDMKCYVDHFYIGTDAFQNTLIRIIKDFSGYILQSQRKAKQVDSVQEADTIFMVQLKKDSATDISTNKSNEWYQIASEVCNEKIIFTIEAYSEIGLKWGIVDLISQTKNDGEGVWIEYPINVSTAPAFSKRGIHLNGWVFDHPYSFRTWSLVDWKSYIDFLFLLKINLLMIWPFIETIPLALSDEDKKYLMDFREIIEYARNEKGMEIWVFMSVNRVCISNDGISGTRIYR
jgi:hypothetical protein